MEIGQKIYTIENRKIIEYTVVQKNTSETKSGIKESILIENSGMFSAIKVTELKDCKHFESRERAEEILNLINEYA